MLTCGFSARLKSTSLAAHRRPTTLVPPSKFTRPPAHAKTPCMCGPFDEVPRHLPAAIVPRLVELTRMTPKQVDVTLQLISLPENSTTHWWKNYGYCENIDDDRGFTVTIFGATSGTGDLVMILDELSQISPRSTECNELLRFREEVRSKNGSDSTRGIKPIEAIIHNLGDDPAWQQAVWKVYLELYWRFAMDWCDKKGECATRPGPVLTTPASRGFMLDVCVNHGADMGSVMTLVRRMDEADRNANDEIQWIVALAKKRRQRLRRRKTPVFDTSFTGDRCTLWLELFFNNPTLTPPFNVYKGYWWSEGKLYTQRVK